MAPCFTSAKSVSLGVNEVHQFGFFKVKKIGVFSFPQICFPRCSSFYRGSTLRIVASGVAGRHRTHFNVVGLRNSTRIVEDPVDFQAGDSDNLKDELQDLFDEVKSLIKLEKQDDARDLLQANYQAALELIDSGSQGMEEAASLDVIALGYMAIGDLRTVESILDVLRKVVDGLNDEELYLDSVLMHMGGLYAQLKRLDLSINLYHRSLQIMEKKYGNNSSVLCILLLRMAQALVSSRRVSEAIESYRRVIKIFESNSNGEGEEVIVPLCEMGNLLLNEGKTSEAELTFSRVIDTFVRLYGEEDGRVGMAMCSLAQVKCAKGEANEAIDLYKNAIQILRGSMALDDEVMEKIRTDLAELLHIVGRAQEGRAILEESLFLIEKSKGKGHPSIVPQLVNLASSHSRSKNYAESERLLRFSLQIMMRNVPPDDPSITFPMLDLAVTLYNLHRYEEAEELTLNVLSIREKAFGVESLPVGEALDCLVCIWTKLEKDGSEVMEVLRRVLKIQEKCFGSESEEVVETLKKMMYFTDKMGVQMEKYPLKRRLFMLRQKRKHMVIY